MKLCIDDANVENIRRVYDTYPVDGVSTNPTILSRTGRPPFEVLKEIRSVVGDGELFVQVISRKAEGMMEEARRIVGELGEKTLMKIPCTPEGFRGMQMLHEEGLRFIGTTVYTPMQGYLATKCGAEYVATYVNRIDNLGLDGVQVSKDIHDIIVRNGYTWGGLLAASFRNTQQVLDLAKYGVKAVTVAPDIIENFVKNPTVDAVLDAFDRDFSGLVGEGRTMADC